ncbi:TadE/TadG family type IV pilus assembly protein [Croceibacterium sp. TMG7-5b_MA50]|uniref:TadE/TadG family type IV pilus assembly protein n=1 Tax=Croceibacterium sp. TMG7-5b_MA50 TaxID=3121290 RepID=UPI0032217837
MEFALALPLFLALMGAGIELSFVMVTAVKVQRLATMTADLVARDGSSDHRLTEAQVYDIFASMNLSAEPLDVRQNGRVIITAVLGEDGDGDGVAEVNRIKWQRFDGGLIPTRSQIGCWSESTVAAGIGRQLNPAEPLFHAQVSYDYEPVFSSTLVKWLNVPQTITRTATFRGRGASYHPVMAVAGFEPKTDCDSPTGL